MQDPGKPVGPSPADLGERLRERLFSLREELDRLRLETDRWSDMVSRFADKPAEAVAEADAALLAASPHPGAVSIDSVRRLDSASGQVEILTRFLEECLRHASRAVLLVERRGRIEPWKSVGFGASAGAPESAGSSLATMGPLDRVRRGHPQRLDRGNEISRAIGAGDAAAAVLFPFVVAEKVSGALYADALDGEAEKLDERALALLTYLTGIAVDRLAKRKLVPAPALRGPEGAAALPAAGAEKTAVAETQPPSFASTPPPDRPAAPLPESDGVPSSAPAVRPATERSLAGPLAPAAESERREEARRFAHLLATEIKLYNEEAVLEGLERGNLYARLKEEIERGRRLYEERIAAEVRSEADFYQDELVGVLAGGRGELLK